MFAVVGLPGGGVSQSTDSSMRTKLSTDCSGLGPAAANPQDATIRGTFQRAGNDRW
jgi:hypothetical protein